MQKKTPINGKHPLKKKDSGFTLVEALIALTLVSLIGISVFMIFTDTVNFSEKVRNVNRWNKELIGLEKVLRKSVSQVKIPFWISDIEVAEGDSLIEVPYWKSDINLILRIEINDDLLKINTPEESFMFNGYNGFESDFLEDEHGRTVGISLLIEKSEKEDMIFQCAFGSIGREVFKEK